MEFLKIPWNMRNKLWSNFQLLQWCTSSTDWFRKAEAYTICRTWWLTVCKRNYFTRLIPYFTTSKFCFLWSPTMHMTILATDQTLRYLSEVFDNIGHFCPWLWSGTSAIHTSLSLWIRVLKELYKYPANISLDQGLKVLIPPPQNLWLHGNQLYACRDDLDEEVFSCVFFCQCTKLTCQMTSLYYLLWVLFIKFWFHTEMSTCWLVGDREWSCLYRVLFKACK